MPCRLPVTAILLALLLSGCGEKPGPEVYTIPKEEETAAPPFVHSPMAGAPSDMAGRQLPAEALNADTANPQWELPGGWEKIPASSMRRASFAATGSAGAVDIAVTSFPGDVGGLLANINRWRGQIGLQPTDAAALAESTEQFTAGGKRVTVARMSGPEQSTHAAIFMHDGNSWFFKMTGPTASVEEQAEAFNQFIQTVQFPSDE